MLKFFFKLFDKFGQIIFFVAIGLFISSFFGGPLSLLKLIFWIFFMVGGYWAGFTLISMPLFEYFFKKIGWNKDLSMALAALTWLWITFSIGLFFSRTELGQWLGDI